MTSKTFNHIFLWLAILSLLILEFLCARLAFETLGEITSNLYFFIVVINIIPLLWLSLKKREELAIGAIVLIALVIVPYQLYLGGKLLHLKEEAANITAYLFKERIENGVYPQDLSGYTFTFPQLKNHFRYQPGSNGQFDLDYYVGTANTSHYYSYELQKWGYYPD